MIYEPLPHKPYRPSPAVSFVGRQNSGKTTLLEKIITELTRQGLAIGTMKHHGHPDFEIDIPGKDYTVIVPLGQKPPRSFQVNAWHSHAT